MFSCIRKKIDRPSYPSKFLMTFFSHRAPDSSATTRILFCASLYSNFSFCVPFTHHFTPPLQIFTEKIAFTPPSLPNIYPKFRIFEPLPWAASWGGRPPLPPLYATDAYIAPMIVQ